MPSCELDLLLTIARGVSTETREAKLGELIEEKLDWGQLAELASYHQVSGLLYYHLKPFARQVEPSFFETLRHSALAAAIHGLFLESELLKFVDLLSEHGIPFVPVKGPVLADLLYENPAMRCSNDLDILVRRENLREVVGLSKKIDYFPPETYTEAVEEMILKQGNHYQILRSDQKSLVEIHWDWLPSSFGLSAVDGGTWERCRSIHWRGRWLSVLGPRDLLLLLTVHGTKHRWPILKWAADVSRLLYLLETLETPIVRAELTGFRWDRFLQVCRRPDLKRMVGVGLLTVERLLGPALPKSIHEEFAADRVAKRLAGRLAKEIFTSRGKLPGLRSTLYRRHFRQNLPDRIQYLSKAVFFPSPIEDEKFRLPRELRWTYPLLRLWRLTLKYLQPKNWRRT